MTIDEVFGAVMLAALAGAGLLVVWFHGSIFRNKRAEIDARLNWFAEQKPETGWSARHEVEQFVLGVLACPLCASVHLAWILSLSRWLTCGMDQLGGAWLWPSLIAMLATQPVIYYIYKNLYTE